MNPAGASETLRANDALFLQLLERARRALRRKRYRTAAAYAEYAAYCATWKHGGRFCSVELEELLIEIGRRIVRREPPAAKDLEGPVRRVLHVATWVAGLQGLNRLLERWIVQDAARTHSLVVTGHGAERVPETLSAAVSRAGGELHVLDPSKRSLADRANTLARLADDADVVVLHPQTEDVLPVIALAETASPVIFVNNADHAFWLGVRVSSVVANLRASGERLSIERRQVPAERNAMLPILLNRRERTRTREEAKASLGLDPESILLLSVAREPKYRPVNGVSFADTHRELIERYPNLHLWVIGPRPRAEWVAAHEWSGGRVRALGPRGDTDVFYEAADIYVDAYPIASITSLIEAGCYEVPLVSRLPYPEECGVLGAGTPALDRRLVRASSDREYLDALSRLIDDVDLRMERGRAARREIESVHFPEVWQPQLEQVYSRARRLARRDSVAVETPGASELDLNVLRVYSVETSPARILHQTFLHRFPIGEQLRLRLETGVTEPALLCPRVVSRFLERVGVKPLLVRGLRLAANGRARASSSS